MSQIGIADCNSFYCSCERVGAPWLEGKPLIVASNNDGCAVALTPEAKKLNIKRGTPLFQLQNLVQGYGVEIRSSNYPLYLDFSNRVMNSIATLVPQYEPYSIDEVFYALPANEFKGEAATEHARQLRSTVRKWTGIPLSVGLASTKTLSKVANHIAKKQEQYQGVFNISSFPQEELDTLLEDTPVEDIWGIGIQRGRTLRQNGITNGLQLKQAPDGWIKKQLTITGLRTVWELGGITCIALEQVSSPNKGMCCAKSFGRPIETLDELKEAVAAYAARLREKLRRQKLAASNMDIFIHTNRFRQDQPQYSNHYTLRLPLSTNYTRN
jgi:DNA polymerase V